MDLRILRGKVSATNSASDGPNPFCRFVNVQLSGLQPQGVKGQRGTILLENPRGDYQLGSEELKKQVCFFSLFFFYMLRKISTTGHFSRLVVPRFRSSTAQYLDRVFVKNRLFLSFIGVWLVYFLEAFIATAFFKTAWHKRNRWELQHDI